MIEQKDSAGWRGETDRRETWSEFDALPWRVKASYWWAPFNYTAAPAHRALIAGRDMRRFVQSRMAGMEADVQRESAAVYGAAQTGWLA